MIKPVKSETSEYAQETPSVNRDSDEGLDDDWRPEEHELWLREITAQTGFQGISNALGTKSEQ